MAPTAKTTPTATTTPEQQPHQQKGTITACTKTYKKDKKEQDNK